MPWRYPDNIPKVAKNWTEGQQKRCISAGNSVLKRGGTDAEAIRACIAAAGKSSRQKQSSLSLAAPPRAPLALNPLPFAGAIASARRRGVVLPEVYYGELTGLARALAFTVSRLATVDQIDRVLKELTRNLEDGNTFADFKRAVEADPDVARFPRGRVETIYRNGVQTAYNRGRAEFHTRHKATRPYFLYSAINDSRVRPAHAAMDNVIAAVDHPIWHRWYPPNGHRCRCSVISLTRAEAERRGVTVDLPDVKPDEGWAYSVMDDPDLGIKDAATKKRQSVNSALAALVPEGIPARLSLDQMIERGREGSERVLERVRAEMARRQQAEGRQIEFTPKQNYELFQESINAEMDINKRAHSKAAVIEGGGKAVKLVREASKRFPDTWTERADRMGQLRVKFSSGRGWHYTVNPDVRKRLVTEGPFFVEAKGGDGFIVAGDYSVALHEYAHRLQSALPELDDYFQELHVRRTAGETLESLRKLSGGAYDADEVTRKDNYIDEYMGKEYPSNSNMYTGRAGALEVMSMAFEDLMGGDRERFTKLMTKDHELYQLTLGLLLHYDP